MAGPAAADASAAQAGPLERYGERILGGGSPVERARLRALEERCDDVTRRLIERLPIGPGMRCLEVGAGAGSVAEFLVGQVGAGYVTATDIEVGFLGHLVRAGVDVRQHDVTADPCPGAAFALIHVRHVLEHIPSREEVLARLACWLEPGGFLLIEAAVTWPEAAGHRAHEAVLRARQTMAAQRLGSDVASWGRHLPGLLESAGLADVRVEGFLRVVRGGPGADFDRLTLERVRPVLVAGRFLADADADAALAAYADPGYLDYASGVIACWGRRPPAADAQDTRI